MQVIGQLQQLGFGDYEARVYAALLQRSPLTGYELAKLSQVPRANIYGVLQKLEDRGAVLRLQTPDGTRYAPVSPEELLGRLSSRFQETLRQAGLSLSQIAQAAEHEQVLNASGYPALLEHAHALIEAAAEHLLLAVEPMEAAALAEALARAEARGVAITTLCLAGCPGPCGACRGQVHRHQVALDDGTRWLIVIQDGVELLAGEIGANLEAALVRTRQRLLVNLLTWYIRHAVALAAVLADLGAQGEPALAAPTLSLLAGLRPQAGDAGWLQAMAALPAARPAAANYNGEDADREPA